uniref:SET domain-containing protein n=2 Tax=Ditylum brightwellii TaxID=49249 RepID=A0A7S4QLI1_9STRA
MEGFDVFGSDSSSDDDSHHNNHSTGQSIVTLNAIAQSITLRDAPVLWEVIDSIELNGGKGLRATTNIAKGVEINRESPLVRCPNYYPAESEEKAIVMHKACVKQKFAQVKESNYQKLMSLFCHDMFCDKEGNTTEYGIYQTNSVKLSGRDSSSGGVFPVMCRMNHSCAANVRHEWNESIEKLFLFADRDIEEGEELYSNYGGFDVNYKTSERRDFLQRNFGFHCLCEKCHDFDDGLSSSSMTTRSK